MGTTIRYVLLTALRDWLFVGLLAGIIAATLISGVLGGTALVETAEMTIVFSAASARVIVMVGLIIFTCFHIRQAFDSKEIDVMVSRPTSRPELMIAYWLGFSLVALLLVAATLAVLSLLHLPDLNGFIVWGASLLAEAILVVAVALFAAFALKSAVTSVIVCLGFYVLSRMMGFFLATTDARTLFDTGWVNQLVEGVLEFAAIIVPRLDFFGKSQWLISGVDGSQVWQLFAIQTLVFVPLLLTAATLDFQRKEF